MKNSVFLLKSYDVRPIWSGNRLSETYPRFKDLGEIGEAWETSVEYGCESFIKVGSRSLPLSEFLKSADLKTPPLVKLLDTSAPLSVQVHPDDAAAEKHGGISKSEIWYVLDAAPDAYILYGTLPEVTLEDVKNVIGGNGDIVPLLCMVPVRKGDIFMIPPGMIHSLGAGITILEVQSCAGTTYRIKDLAGNRETHTLEACDSIKIYSHEEAASLAFQSSRNDLSIDIPGNVIACTPEYIVTRYVSKNAFETLHIERSSIYMFCESGGGICGDISFTAGDSLYLSTHPHHLSLLRETSVIFVK